MTSQTHRQGWLRLHLIKERPQHHFPPSSHRLILSLPIHIQMAWEILCIYILSFGLRTSPVIWLANLFIGLSPQNLMGLFLTTSTTSLLCFLQEPNPSQDHFYPTPSTGTSIFQLNHGKMNLGPPSDTMDMPARTNQLVHYNFLTSVKNRRLSCSTTPEQLLGFVTDCYELVLLCHPILRHPFSMMKLRSIALPSKPYHHTRLTTHARKDIL